VNVLNVATVGGHDTPFTEDTFDKLETFRVDGVMYTLKFLSMILSTAMILDGVKYEPPPIPICTIPAVLNDSPAELLSCKADPE
jgi:hypothetical protein